MFRIIIFVHMLCLAVLLTGCETAPSSQYLAREAEYGSVSDSVTVHFNCREETKSYRGDSASEIEMFTKCMEREGYGPDGKPLGKPAPPSSSTE
jgi:hypothetical protein